MTCVGIQLPDLRCLEDREEVCAFIEQFDAPCIDEDGDCFVASCGDGVDPDVALALRDCDDIHFLNNPLSSELCDQNDNDCDGATDEDFELGGSCAEEGPCGAGVTECAIDDPTQVACSTQSGQSEAVADLDESCDGLDDDCDGIIDERCRVGGVREHAGPELHAPAEPMLCAGRLVFAQGSNLVTVDLEAPSVAEAETVRTMENVVKFPNCSADWNIWLEVEGDDPCRPVAEQADLTTCTGRLKAQRVSVQADAAGQPPVIELASLGRYGPPVVSEGLVYWHMNIADVGTRLSVVDLSMVEEAQSELLFADGMPLSDPTVSIDGRILVRNWEQGGLAGPHVEIRNRLTMGRQVLPNPGDWSGPPTQSRDWLSWTIGFETPTLWVVSTNTPDFPRNAQGFQPIVRPGPHRKPHLVGDILVWLDQGGVIPSLRSLDLSTGVEREIAAGNIEPDDFTVGSNLVVWIEETDAGFELKSHPMSRVTMESDPALEEASP
jgi:hypothetical protein